jgi:DNA-binding NarL/FixJ family response regulator
MSVPGRIDNSGNDAGARAVRAVGNVSAQAEAKKIARLTNREREIVALVGEGLKNAEIAERLFISPKTVRHHLSSVFTKLDVPDRLKLIVYAYQHGLARLPNEK